ncbi:MAG: SRPBCC family protein [Chloroflexota bacterium]
MSTESSVGRGQGLAAQFLRARTVIAVYAALIALYVVFLHSWMMPWSATAEEQRLALPGDEAAPESYYTRAITVDAPTAVVWQWIVQIGQDRAGFYSNTWLENLFGGDIHNHWEIRPEWQQLALGDTVPMAPRGNPLGDVTLLRIAALEPGRMIADLPGRWVLLALDDHTARVLLREVPQGPIMGEAFAYWVYDPMHFVMEQRMLRGLKERAEGQPFVPPLFQTVAQLGWIAAGAALLGFYLSRRRHWPWLVLPLVAVADGLVLGHDPQAALAGFLAVGITVAGALFFGRRWWSAYAYLGAFVLLVLLFAPDAYTAFGLLFALTGVAAGALLYRSRRRATRLSSRLRTA